MKTIEDYEDIKKGMVLKCLSEDYEGDVILLNNVLQTDCCGWGYEPISNLDLTDIVILD